jgi:hypothetical protein
MNIKEIKQEINKTLDRIPEEVLGEILDYLKKLEGKKPDTFTLARDLKKILEEDKHLLERLAQ